MIISINIFFRYSVFYYQITIVFIKLNIIFIIHCIILYIFLGFLFWISKIVSTIFPSSVFIVLSVHEFYCIKDIWSIFNYCFISKHITIRVRSSFLGFAPLCISRPCQIIASPFLGRNEYISSKFFLSVINCIFS